MHSRPSFYLLSLDLSSALLFASSFSVYCCQIILRQRFLGLSNLEQKLGLPPDAVIATGRYQVLEASNDFERIAIYRKSITSRTMPAQEKKVDKYGACQFDEHGMPKPGPGNFPYGGPLGGWANGYGFSAASASTGYSAASFSSADYGFGGYDAQYSRCTALGCGAGGDCDYNGYEDEYAGGSYGAGGDFGNNGGYGNTDFGRSGMNIDLDYTSAAANGKDKSNQKGGQGNKRNNTQRENKQRRSAVQRNQAQ